LLKPVSLEDFRNTISRVVHGGTALCDEAQAILLSFIRRTFTHGTESIHSNRELQIMVCLAQRLSDKEIAERLNIAPNTVHVHLVHLFKLFGVHDRNEAARKFLEGCVHNSCSRCQIAHR